MEIVNLKDHMKYVPELAKLHFEEWGHLWPNESDSDRLARITDICAAAHVPALLIAIDGENLVGSAGLKARDGLLPDLDLTPWLFGVYVKAEYRSHGVAAMLISEVEKIASDANFSALHLCTHHHEAYYERLGYRTIHVRDFCGEDTFIMIKPMK
jgi:GNAT superfamily N-acetyltransferase